MILVLKVIGLTVVFTGLCLQLVFAGESEVKVPACGSLCPGAEIREILKHDGLNCGYNDLSIPRRAYYLCGMTRDSESCQCHEVCVFDRCVPQER